MQAAQALDLVVDITRLHRTAAGTVDADDDALGVLVLERRPQAIYDLVGAGRASGTDHAADINQCRMAAGKAVVFAEPAHADEQDGKQVQH